MPTLKSDIEIKQAVAAAAQALFNLAKAPGCTTDGFQDSMPLREIRLPYTNIAPGRLPAQDPAATDQHPGDYLMSQVMVFCPVPYKNWQYRANRVLLDQVKDWREQLKGLKTKLATENMYSVPFGRFLAAGDEGPEKWVGPIEPGAGPDGETIVGKLAIRHQELFRAGQFRSEATVDYIYYYLRPHIVWPLLPGTRDHVTHLPDVHKRDGTQRSARRLVITCPPLTDPRLRVKKK